MNPEDAIRSVRERFPFPGYMEPCEGAHRNIARTVLRYLPPGARILDFGSGPCDKSAILQLLGFRCSAYDDFGDDWHRIEGTLEKILKFARGFGIDLRIADGGPLPFERESFDMAMLHDVLEHLHDSPRDLVNDLLERVKPGGVLFVTVPSAVNIRKRGDVLFGKTNLPSFERYYWYPGPWRGHVREYTRGDLEQLVEFLDLELLELRGCHHMLQKVPRGLGLFYLVMTSVFTGWRDSWTLVARKRPVWTPRRALPQDELHRILSVGTTYRY